jgi:hypothetical protein
MDNDYLWTPYHSHTNWGSLNCGGIASARGHERRSNDGPGVEQEVAVNDAPRKRVENSNANENKQLTSPIIAENAAHAANFAPFRHSF